MAAWLIARGNREFMEEFETAHEHKQLGGDDAHSEGLVEALW
jgi:hypothetical protein